MAGLSTKAIKTRIKSMASTRQITKAMELVASSKLRSAQSRAVACRPYFTALYEAMNEIADSSRSFESPYLRQAGPGKTIYIVIAGDRGLAGGYNNNVLKLAFRQMPQDAVVLPIGKKTVEFFQHRSCEILTEEYSEAASVSIGDCYSFAMRVAPGPARARLRRRARKLSLVARTDHSGTRGVPPHLIQKECESFVNQKHRHRRPGHRTGARHPLPGGEPAEPAQRDHA